MLGLLKIAEENPAYSGFSYFRVLFGHGLCLFPLRLRVVPADGGSRRNVKCEFGLLRPASPDDEVNVPEFPGNQNLKMGP